MASDAHRSAPPPPPSAVGLESQAEFWGAQADFWADQQRVWAEQAAFWEAEHVYWSGQVKFWDRHMRLVNAVGVVCVLGLVFAALVLVASFV